MPALITKERAISEGWFQPNELDGLCHCGCGEPTDIANESSSKWGYVKGEHYRFCHGHGKLIGEAHPYWRGGRRKQAAGYILVKVRDHPNTDMHGYILEHRLVMEQIVGRHLTSEETVHHINEIKDDNRPENLMLFANSGDHLRYHALVRRGLA